MVFPAIPAKAGIQEKQPLLDPGFRRGDHLDDFSGGHQLSTGQERLFFQQLRQIEIIVPLFFSPSPQASVPVNPALEV